MRETSRLAPGLFSISRTPITCIPTGTSTEVRKGVGRTVTASSCAASSSISISMKGVEAETRYSGVRVVR